MRYIISEAAKADMIQLYLDGVKKHGEKQAVNYYESLIKQFELVAKSPRIHAERIELTPPVRVCPYGMHMILYMIKEDDDMCVLRVRHSREDWL